jgi:molybdate transport system permease protein
VTHWTAADSAIVWLTVKVSVVAVLASTVPAIAVAWLLARGRFWGRSLLNVAVHLPLVVPPVVTGYLLLILFGRRGAAGMWLERYLGLQLSFRWTGAALAAAVMAFPLIVRTIRLGIEHVDTDLEDAGATLGAGPITRFLTITLPLALPAVAAGLVIGFAKALGEFGATIMFVSNIPGETQTLALAIFTDLERPGGESAAMRLIWMSIALSVVALLVSEWLVVAFQKRKTA